MLASAADVEDGPPLPPWRPGHEYASDVLLDVISSRSALWGPGNDVQRFALLQSIINTDIGRGEGGVPSGEDSLLAENGRLAGCSLARVPAAFFAVDLHVGAGNVSTG